MIKPHAGSEDPASASGAPALFKLKCVLGAIAMIVAGACGDPAHGPVASPADGSTVSTIQASAIEAHMRFLAGDLLEGREAGTRGYDVAAAYVASQFQLLGLRPAGVDGTYFQPVPLQAHRFVPGSSRFIVHRTGPGAPSRALTVGTDYIVSSSATEARTHVSAPAVFVGYGIAAPAFSHDDYAGLDVKGKVVVFFLGYPSTWPSEEGAHYGSTAEKAREAQKRGAIGMLGLYTERFEAVYPWERAAAAVDSTAMNWIGPDGVPHDPAPDVRAGALLSPASGALLFDGAPRSYQEVREEAAKGAPKGFALGVSLDLSYASTQERRSSANVAGVLPGSDPALAGEQVVLLGHLDHEGIGPAVNGDVIYNGALDNAGGIAGLIEAARSLARGPKAPRRSILFLAVTAEEKGMVGSDYFSRYPTVEREAIVAAVNLDMPVLRYDFTDVIAFGAEHSSLKATLESALSRTGLTLTADPMPDQAVFTRSDHYSFVQRGVPSIFLSTGWNTSAGPGEGGKVFMDFLSGDYHRPSDDLTKPIDFQAGAKFAHVNALILSAIADAEARPTWNADDFFGTLFVPAPAAKQ